MMNNENPNPNKNLKPGTRSPSHETLRRKCSSNMEDDESATNRWQQTGLNTQQDNKRMGNRWRHSWGNQITYQITENHKARNTKD